MPVALRTHEMGWRERDYAKFTDEEFAAIYGASPRRGGSGGGPPLVGSGVGWAAPAGRSGSPRGRRRRGGGFLRALGLLGFSVVATAIILGGAIVTGRVPSSS